MAFDPHESDQETKRKIGREKGQRSIDSMHKRSGFDDAFLASGNEAYSTLTPQQRLAMKRAEQEESDDE